MLYAVGCNFCWCVHCFFTDHHVRRSARFEVERLLFESRASSFMYKVGVAAGLSRTFFRCFSIEGMTAAVTGETSLFRTWCLVTGDLDCSYSNHLLPLGKAMGTRNNRLPGERFFSMLINSEKNIMRRQKYDVLICGRSERRNCEITISAVVLQMIDVEVNCDEMSRFVIYGLYHSRTGP